MEKFKTQKELHDYIRSLHGKGTDAVYAVGKELYELSSKDPDSYFGYWGFDYAGCSKAVGLAHSSDVDGYEYTFWFEPDGSDTVADDTIEDENGEEVYLDIDYEPAEDTEDEPVKTTSGTTEYGVADLVAMLAKEYGIDLSEVDLSKAKKTK